MKKKIVILIACMPVLWLVLPVHAEKRAQKVPYVFPEAMSPAVRAEFTKECDKGQALYQLACASCHSKTENGRVIVPDWSSAQLVGYELRVKNQKHEEDLPDEKVTAEELGYIMTFLTYKKKNTP